MGAGVRGAPAGRTGLRRDGHGCATKLEAKARRRHSLRAQRRWEKVRESSAARATAARSSGERKAVAGAAAPVRPRRPGELCSGRICCCWLRSPAACSCRGDRRPVSMGRGEGTCDQAGDPHCDVNGRIGQTVPQQATGQSPCDVSSRIRRPSAFSPLGEGHRLTIIDEELGHGLHQTNMGHPSDPQASQLLQKSTQVVAGGPSTRHLLCWESERPCLLLGCVFWRNGFGCLL